MLLGCSSCVRILALFDLLPAVSRLACESRLIFLAGLLHVDMFAHNKSGIACQDRYRQPETVGNHKGEPHQQPRPLLSCPN
jgi:hypothetical protein